MRLYGKEDLKTLEYLLNLSVVLEGLGRSEQAEKSYMKILDLTQTLREDHAPRLVAMTSIGIIYILSGRTDKGVELHRKCFEISKRSLAENHLETLTFMVSLGNSLGLAGKLGEAEELQLKVLETFRQLGLNQHPSALSAGINLADVYFEQGRTTDGITILE
ncbi:Similar to Nephrocystin-3; acc. no. Q7TNH6 [Pyronema omphalodes CBS 100304]|uniref:Similar to Nephrocystin-3 acc. no. Q7TNH6 n=1 Tax=Pyronema omphalodes (strain CBS 100304) TaxID=1076935 RepID=U4LFQ1_PYROM|nr:Similar to Nephrocystin-3; acc. no. Q7TNH6 [Pyronema omphalodes CBS 100304]